jgi:hypothetical protein
LRREADTGYSPISSQKKDRANIDDDELKDFRLLAKSYAELSSAQLTILLEDGTLLEICDGE